MKPKTPRPDRQILSGVVATCIPPVSSRTTEGKIIVFDSWCKRCGICSHFCPTGALEADSNGVPYLAFAEKCTLCGMCWMRCPDLAITKNQNYKGETKEKKRNGNNE